jgi:hypothetical protein
MAKLIWRATTAFLKLKIIRLHEKDRRESPWKWRNEAVKRSQLRAIAMGNTRKKNEEVDGFPHAYGRLVATF